MKDLLEAILVVFVLIASGIVGLVAGAYLGHRLGFPPLLEIFVTSMLIIGATVGATTILFKLRIM
jgi:uncharacterized membrane protein YeaQ/YmgE (transglycosylase-associated protein family)